MTAAREEMMPLNEIGKRVAHVVNAKWAVTLWHRPRITGHSGNPLDTLWHPLAPVLIQIAATFWVYFSHFLTQIAAMINSHTPRTGPAHLTLLQVDFSHYLTNYLTSWQIGESPENASQVNTFLSWKLKKKLQIRECNFRVYILPFVNWKHFQILFS